MHTYKDKLTRKYGYLEGNADAVAEELSAKAVNYKKDVVKSYLSLNPAQISSQISGNDFYVTRKYDGELNLIFYENGEVFILNRSGRVRIGLPCVEEAGKALANAGIMQAIVPSELYLDETNGRTRVFDVLEALADEKRTHNLRLAPFDVYEIDGELYKPASYEQTYSKLKAVFDATETCRPVKMQKATSKQEISAIFDQWTLVDGGEGLVVRCELPFVYKIKPRYTVDVIVVGFSEGVGEQKGQVRSLLLAMMPDEGLYQIVGRSGSGLNEDLKKQLFDQLTPAITDSQYIETDSNHVAFHMVKPELVIELIVNDVLFETSSGPIVNPLLELQHGHYVRRSSVDGISFVYPIFERIRNDKYACIEDARLSQINSFAYVPESNETAPLAELPKSTLIQRDVYKKQTGAKLMVRKFIAWKTNKEANPDYPAFVFAYTDFSSERKEPLQREVIVSNSELQIREIIQRSIADNIKSGWLKTE
ncbi:MAG: hypothetical protein LBD45_04385 [Bacteroidales bacterium]|jgi:hypothetical protein|nr:hypothetical protein [Bacteroidales bacterium]